MTLDESRTAKRMTYLEKSLETANKLEALFKARGLKASVSEGYAGHNVNVQDPNAKRSCATVNVELTREDGKYGGRNGKPAVKTQPGWGRRIPARRFTILSDENLKTAVDLTIQDLAMQTEVRKREALREATRIQTDAENAGLVAYLKDNLFSVPDGFSFKSDGQTPPSFNLYVAGSKDHHLAGPWSPAEALEIVKGVRVLVGTLHARQQEQRGVTPG